LLRFGSAAEILAIARARQQKELKVTTFRHFFFEVSDNSLWMQPLTIDQTKLVRVFYPHVIPARARCSGLSFVWRVSVDDLGRAASTDHRNTRRARSARRAGRMRAPGAAEHNIHLPF
jgi:hypothetical protein